MSLCLAIPFRLALSNHFYRLLLSVYLFPSENPSRSLSFCLDLSIGLFLSVYLNIAHLHTQCTIQLHTTLIQEHSGLDLILQISISPNWTVFIVHWLDPDPLISTHIRFIHPHCWVYPSTTLHDNPERHSFHLWAHTVSLSYCYRPWSPRPDPTPHRALYNSTRAQVQPVTVLHYSLSGT